MGNKSSSLYRFFDAADEPTRKLRSLKTYEKLPLMSLKQAIQPLIPHVAEIERMVNMIEGYVNRPRNNLTFDESSSILLYLMDWSPHANSFGIILNKTLRNPKREALLPLWLNFLKLFITALSKLPSIENQIIYRAAKLDLHAHYKKGERIVWYGFSSCLPSLETLNADESFQSSDDKTLFIIQCLDAKDISQYSFVPNEQILLPGREFEVISLVKKDSKFSIVQLKEISMKQITSSEPFPEFKTSAQLVTEPYFSLNITDDDIQRIIKESIIQKKCTELNLSCNNIQHNGAAILGNILRSNTTLTKLDLFSNAIEDKGAQYLADALQHNKTLTILNIGANEIGDIGAQRLADRLQHNKTLIALKLSDNEIGDFATRNIADLLRYNSTLITLDLSNNQIGDFGVQQLANGLEGNKKLIRLDLGSNEIGDHGAKYLADGLQRNKTLITLNLSFNRIGDFGAQYLANGLQHNKILAKLDIEGNRMVNMPPIILRKLQH